MRGKITYKVVENDKHYIVNRGKYLSIRRVTIIPCVPYELSLFVLLIALSSPITLSQYESEALLIKQRET